MVSGIARLGLDGFGSSEGGGSTSRLRFLSFFFFFGGAVEDEATGCETFAFPLEEKMSSISEAGMEGGCGGGGRKEKAARRDGGRRE